MQNKENIPSTIPIATPFEKGAFKHNLIIKGLSKEEVQKQYKDGKSNSYKIPTSRSYWQILQENVFTFINSILFSIAIALVLVGKISDAFVYIVVVLLNIVVGLVQEIKAKKQLDEIASLTKPNARVVRDGEESEIDSHLIVVGDILVASSGDLIAVDGEVVEGTAQMDESLLTGESSLVEKNINSKVFSGSFVSIGKIYFKAEKVGVDSLANQLAGGAKAYRKVLTPVQKDINLTVRILFFISIFLGSLNVLASLVERTSFSDGLQITAVILGIIPNSLFVMINLAYALGAVAILKHGALIQQLNSVESLSHVDVLCLDKTGTLTTNNIELLEVINDDKLDFKAIDILADFGATISSPNKTIEAIKIKHTGLKQEIIEEVPFSSHYKWSGLSWKNKSDTFTVVIGALESLQNSIVFTKKHVETISQLQNQGLRVVIYTYENKILNLKNKTGEPYLPKTLKNPHILVFKNELRPEASQTLEYFKQAGVEIKIISGDTKQTVVALARQLGMGDNLTAVSGDEIKNLSSSQFNETVLNTRVFGRITPTQKEAIVLSLKSAGKYVGMIGDGVNDVLPLKKSDLAISMQSGSQATRNVADIVLLNDSFASLPKGVIEGQKIRNGLENIFKLYLTRVIYTILLILTTSLARLPFPFTVKQSSLLATISTGLPALALTTWTYPGITRNKTLLGSVMSFVVSASISISIFATILFFGFSYAKTFSGLTFSLAIRTNIVELRTILSSFVIIAGLILVAFVSPPSKNFGDIYNQDKNEYTWKPFILSLLLIVSYLVCLCNQDFQAFWGLSELSLSTLFIILISGFMWAIFLQFSWKCRWFYRFLS